MKKRPNRRLPEVAAPIDIRALRLAKGLSIETASEQMGVPFNTLARVERGENQPRLHTAQAIARFYGLPVDSIWPPTNGRKAA